MGVIFVQLSFVTVVRLGTRVMSHVRVAVKSVNITHYVIAENCESFFFLNNYFPII